MGMDNLKHIALPLSNNLVSVKQWLFLKGCYIFHEASDYLHFCHCDKIAWQKNHLRSEKVCFISQFQDMTSPSLWGDRDDTWNSMHSREQRCKNTLQPDVLSLLSTLLQSRIQTLVMVLLKMGATATDTPTDQPDVDTPSLRPSFQVGDSRLYHVNN